MRIQTTPLYPVAAHRTVEIYAGLTFKISISFPLNYPYAAPIIRFDTPCYHPNVDIVGGAICLDILQVTFNILRMMICIINLGYEG